ncbi:MAG: caspase family protein [Planctomycetaceae bacterium]
MPLEIPRNSVREPDGDLYTLLIGISYNDSRTAAPLPYCGSDVGKLKESLDHFGAKTTTMIDPTKSEIIKQRRVLADTVTARDRFVVFLSGHGCETTQANAGICLVPKDGELTSVETLLRIDDVIDIIEDRCAGLAILVDACRIDPRQAAK